VGAPQLSQDAESSCPLSLEMPPPPIKKTEEKAVNRRHR
jgi:hypothetical protein